MAQNSITQGSIGKQLLAFFFPIWLGTFFQYFYNTADAVIIGNFVGKEALAAVGGPTGTIINLLVGLFVGLSSGATVIISQYYGAADKENTAKSVQTAAALSIGISLVLTISGTLFAPWMLRAMGTPEDVLEPSITYLRIYFLGITGAVIYNFGSSMLRAVGDARRPLYFLILCSFTNVILDLIFVVWFSWGVAGVALATVLSQTISAVLVVLSLTRTTQMYRLEPKSIRFDLPILKKMIRIGLPAGLQSLMYSASNFLIQAGINSFGTNTVAAWTAYGKLDGFYWMTVNSFGISITTFAGQNFGARQYDRMKKSVRICVMMCTVATLTLSGLLLLFAPQLYRIFTQDAEVIAIGITMVSIITPFYVTYVGIEILSGALRGAGDALIPTLITALGMCVLRVGWITIVMQVAPTLQNVCISYPLTWFVTSLCFIIYYTKGGWLKRCQQKAGHDTIVAVEVK